jgi:hypothetical protein
LRCRPGSICRQPRSSRARFTPSPGSRERGGRGRVREGFFLSGSQLSWARLEKKKRSTRAKTKPCQRAGAGLARHM